ncbi:MAG: sigma-54 dependent transcriptional regulator [Candidatus Aminicenantes bacterium]|nr:sigma-54 dependent transcriptional regulator [Candidatus Aminicenantes bacterium]
MSESNGNGHGQAGGDIVLLGRSDAFLHVLDLIDRLKDLDTPVFISGESGTGKEIIARAIHFRGLRSRGRFVAVNGGAIPDNLLESELFGYARGSFTGALRDKPGLIEEAGGGTFFLDEVGDLGYPLQAKLLRVLQEHEIRRIGETRNRPVDVRFISATNKNLDREVGLGRFREDLYYRLRIVTIDVPPLRERRDDLELLLHHFIVRYGEEIGRPRVYFTPRVMETLLAYPWPGNVRELQNEIQRCLILCGNEGIVRVEHLSPRLNPGRPSVPAPETFNFFEAKADFVRRFLGQALRRHENNKARTAEEIGLSRQALFKLLKKHRIETPGVHEDSEIN